MFAKIGVLLLGVAFLAPVGEGRGFDEMMYRQGRQLSNGNVTAQTNFPFVLDVDLICDGVPKSITGTLASLWDVLVLASDLIVGTNACGRLIICESIIVNVILDVGQAATGISATATLNPLFIAAGANLDAHNIAVLRLDRRLNLTLTVGPITLPPVSLNIVPSLRSLAIRLGSTATTLLRGVVGITTSILGNLTSCQGNATIGTICIEPIVLLNQVPCLGDDHGTPIIDRSVSVLFAIVGQVHEVTANVCDFAVAVSILENLAWITSVIDIATSGNACNTTVTG